MSSTQGNATIFSLQSYITELTCYINENNAKYTKNLQTLKAFYETQVQELQHKLISVEDENHQARNDLLATRDLVNNREKQLNDLKGKSAQTRQQNQQLRQKLMNQRQKIDHLYEEMQGSKKELRKDLNQQQKVIKQVQNEKNDLLFKLKERQQQISRLSKDIQRLQDQVSQRYSLPQKLKDIQIESAKNKTLVQSLTQGKRQLETKLDFQSNQLQRLRKENKRLEVSYETRDTNARHDLNEALTKQRQLGQEKHRRLQSTNEKQLFQINQLQNSLKLLKKQNTQLQNKLQQYIEECKHLQQRILNHDNQKDRYIEEFHKLKKEYEDVIKNLQDSIPKYQRKNWELQQQNRDLNGQLDGLRDLFNQVRAINSLQPLKQQYRQIAQLQLLAQKDYKAYRQQQVFKEYSKANKSLDGGRNISPVKDLKDNDEFKWDKLLAEIDNIQVA